MPRQDAESKIKVVVEAKDKKAQSTEIQDKIKAVLVKKNRNSVGVFLTSSSKNLPDNNEQINALYEHQV